MDTLSIVAISSIFSASAVVAIAGSFVAIAEGNIATEGMKSIAQQPDEANNISKIMFISIAMIESCAIYALVIAMILIFANPFWSALIAK